MVGLVDYITDPDVRGTSASVNPVGNDTVARTIEAVGEYGMKAYAGKTTGDVRRGLKGLEDRWMSEQGMQSSLQAMIPEYEELNQQLSDPNIDAATKAALNKTREGLDKAANAISQNLMTPVQYQTAVNMIVKRAIDRAPGLTQEITSIGRQYSSDPVTFMVNNRIDKWEESIRQEKEKEDWQIKELTNALAGHGIYVDANTTPKESMLENLNRIEANKASLIKLEEDKKLSNLVGVPLLKKKMVAELEIADATFKSALMYARDNGFSGESKEIAANRINESYAEVYNQYRKDNPELEEEQLKEVFASITELRDYNLDLVSREDLAKSLATESDIAIQRTDNELNDMSGGLFRRVKVLFNSGLVDIGNKQKIIDEVGAVIDRLYGQKGELRHISGESYIGRLSRLLKNTMQEKDYDQAWSVIHPMLIESNNKIREGTLNPDAVTPAQMTEYVYNSLDTLNEFDQSLVPRAVYDDFKPHLDREMQSMEQAMDRFKLTPSIDNGIVVLTPENPEAVKNYTGAIRVMTEVLNKSLNVRSKINYSSPEKEQQLFIDNRNAITEPQPKVNGSSPAAEKPSAVDTEVNQLLDDAKPVETQEAVDAEVNDILGFLNDVPDDYTGKEIAAFLKQKFGERNATA